MYTALQIAHFIINLCNQNGRPVSNLELQKILYFLQLYHMRSYNGALLFSDDICAWKYGPVVPSVYNIYNGYGGGLIRNFYDCSDINLGIQQLLAPVIISLEQRGSWNLVDLTHGHGTPWEITYNKGDGNRDVISNELIMNDRTPF